jgi:hypothetical protein
MKDFYYDYGYNFIKLYKDKEVPNFIKEASSLEHDELNSLPDSAFASESTRTLPISDPANVFMSAVYYYGANPPNEAVESRIIKAAKFFDILEDVESIKSDLSSNKKSANFDGTWEIFVKTSNGTVSKFSGTKNSIEKFANEFIEKIESKCDFNGKVSAAEKIASTLEKYNILVPERIAQLSARNISNTEKLAEQIKARAIRISDDSKKAELCKLADALQESSDKNIDGMKKIAEVLEKVDSQNNLKKYYNKFFLDPFASVFNTSVDEAKKMAKIIEIGNSSYDSYDIQKIDIDILKKSLSKEAQEIIGLNTESPDLSKLNEISEADKVILASYL